MNFTFSSNAFRKYSLSEAADTISDAGYTGIEIMCDTPHAYPPDLSAADVSSIKKELTGKD
jgi:sugar phosphate isomerase/epimerase